MVQLFWGLMYLDYPKLVHKHPAHLAPPVKMHVLREGSVQSNHPKIILRNSLLSLGSRRFLSLNYPELVLHTLHASPLKIEKIRYSRTTYVNHSHDIVYNIINFKGLVFGEFTPFKRDINPFMSQGKLCRSIPWVTHGFGDVNPSHDHEWLMGFHVFFITTNNYWYL
jgi:hypothetical protein